MSDEETTAITVQLSPLALLDDVDLEQVMSAKLVPSEKHIYSFRQQGSEVTGLSIDGTRDAARALSTKGEAIREIWVRCDKEDDREAYFTACAARYAISPDGREICMDTAIRAKRQPKYVKRADGSGEKFIDAWYEIGVAKAVRNATEALLPEALKEHMIKQAKLLARGNAGTQQQAPQRRSDDAGSDARKAAQHSVTEGAGEPRAVKPQDEARALLKEIVSQYAGPFAKRVVATFAVEGKTSPSGAPAFAQYTPEEVEAAVATMRHVLQHGDLPGVEGTQVALDA